MKRCLGLLATLILSTSAVADDAISWQHDLEQAKRTAAQTGRLVLVHFWADWCGPCRTLEKEVFSKQDVAQAIEAKYVPVKVNVDHSQPLAAMHGVRSLPTDIIMDPTGQVVDRFVSPSTPRGYMVRVEQVAAAHHSKSGGALAGSSNPYANVLAAHNGSPQAPTTPQQNVQPQAGNHPPATAGQGSHAGAGGDDRYPPMTAYPPQLSPQHGDRYSPYMAQQQQPPAANPADTVPPDNAEVHNPYAPAGSAGQPAPPQVRMNPYAPASGDAAPNHPAAQHTPYTGGAPTVQQGTPYAIPAKSAPPTHAVAKPPGHAPPHVQANPHHAAGQQPAGPHQDGPHQGGQRAGGPQYLAAHQGPRTPAAPPAQDVPAARPPRALEGYCPVALMEKQHWAKGDAKWGAVHRARVYLFSSEEAQKRFLADPDRFSPVLSGVDPVLALDEGKSVDGDRRHGVYFGDHVFLFASEETLQRFSQNPARYAEGVRQAMQRVDQGTVRR